MSSKKNISSKQPKTQQPSSQPAGAKRAAPKKLAAAAKRPTARQPTAKQQAKPLRLRRTSSSDLLALVVLALSASLAACNKNKSNFSPTTVAAPAPGGSVTVRFLDVGQGDAVLIRSPEGKTMLIDGGRSAARMAEHMKTYQIDKIDLLVATHADSDHITGLIEAAKANPTLFINNGIGGTTRTWEKLVTALQDGKTTFQKANNQTINLGSVKVHVIAPPDGVPANDQNDHSVGIRLDFGNFHALMTGDSETPETKRWLAENNPEVRGPVQLYKSIHHGAANGDNQAWLESVQPANVVISVGQPNNYGHPTEKALDLYKRNKVNIYRTDEQGTVTFTGNTDGTYKVTTEK